MIRSNQYSPKYTDFQKPDYNAREKGGKWKEMMLQQTLWTDVFHKQSKHVSF